MYCLSMNEHALAAEMDRLARVRDKDELRRQTRRTFRIFGVILLVVIGLPLAYGLFVMLTDK